jgi:hypothetical protein
LLFTAVLRLITAVLLCHLTQVTVAFSG